MCNQEDIITGVYKYVNECRTNAREASLWQLIKEIKETFGQEQEPVGFIKRNLTQTEDRIEVVR